MEALVDEEAVADEPAEGADDSLRVPDKAGEEHTAEMLLHKLADSLSEEAAEEEEAEEIQGKS